MKFSVCQFLSITCILCFGLLTLSPICDVYAKDYLTLVKIEIAEIHHDDGSVTNHVLSVSETYSTHHPIGSHFHPSPSFEARREPEPCTDTACSRCS